MTHLKVKTCTTDNNIIAVEDNDAVFLYLNGKKYKYSNITEIEKMHNITFTPLNTNTKTMIGDFKLNGEFFLPTIDCKLPLYKKIITSDVHYVAGYVAIFANSSIRIRKCPKLNTLILSNKFSKPYTNRSELKRLVDANQIDWYSITDTYHITRSK